MQNHRNGKFIRGRHTTCTPIAGIIVDALHKVPNATGVSLGVITPLQGARRSARISIKITIHNNWHILKVTSHEANQEIKLYGSVLPHEIHSTILAHKKFKKNIPRIITEDQRSQI